MIIRKTLAVFSVTAILCGTASAQFFDMEDDPWAFPETSTSETPATSAGWDDTPQADNQTPATQAAPTPAPAATAKPAPAPRPERQPKPARQQSASASASASDGTLNIFGSVGAAFRVGGYYVGAEIDFHDGLDLNSSSKELKDRYQNLGQGMRFEVGVGYMALPNIETRFSVDYNAGLFAPNTERRYNVTLPGGEPRPVIVGSKHSYYMLSFKAMIIPQFEVLEMFDMYAGAGISLDIVGASFDSSNYNPGDLSVRNASYNREMAPRLGLNGVIGANFPMSDAMSFFGELQFAAVNFTVNRNRVASYSTGTATDNWAPSDQVFKKDDTTPRHENLNSPPLIPGSNWSLRFGVKYWVF